LALRRESCAKGCKKASSGRDDASLTEPDEGGENGDLPRSSKASTSSAKDLGTGPCCHAHRLSGSWPNYAFPEAGVTSNPVALATAAPAARVAQADLAAGSEELPTTELRNGLPAVAIRRAGARWSVFICPGPAGEASIQVDPSLQTGPRRCVSGPSARRCRGTDATFRPLKECHAAATVAMARFSGPGSMEMARPVSAGHHRRCPQAASATTAMKRKPPVFSPAAADPSRPKPREISLAIETRNFPFRRGIPGQQAGLPRDSTFASPPVGPRPTPSPAKGLSRGGGVRGSAAARQGAAGLPGQHHTWGCRTATSRRRSE